MSTQRIPDYAGHVKPSSLPKGPNGLPLCRWCSQEVQPPRLTFCCDDCVEQHKIRTQPGFAKVRVFERDHGVCALCGVDTCASLKGPVCRSGHSGGMPGTGYLFRVSAACSRFDMDHIVPVIEGGGSCGLDNLRTLCRPCHKLETAKLAKRRAERRKAGAT